MRIADRGKPIDARALPGDYASLAGNVYWLFWIGQINPLSMEPHRDNINAALWGLAIGCFLVGIIDLLKWLL